MFLSQLRLHNIPKEKGREHFVSYKHITNSNPKNKNLNTIMGINIINN